MIIQDRYRNDPLKLLTCCALLNRSRGVDVLQVARELFAMEEWPSVLLDTHALERVIHPLGLQKQKAETLARLMDWWLDGAGPDNLPDGFGEYARQSYDTFIGRQFIHPDKHVDRIVQAYASQVDLGCKVTEIIRGNLTDDGRPAETRNGMMLELYAFCYTYNHLVFWQPTDISYVDAKMIRYEPELDRINEELWKDSNTRRATIVFDQEMDPPDCIVAIHFQLRREREREQMMVNVFQRSQDVDMIQTDADIVARMCCRLAEHHDFDGYRVSHVTSNMHMKLSERDNG